jgi:hypothetical protein
MVTNRLIEFKQRGIELCKEYVRTLIRNEMNKRAKIFELNSRTARYGNEFIIIARFESN